MKLGISTQATPDSFTINALPLPQTTSVCLSVANLFSSCLWPSSYCQVTHTRRISLHETCCLTLYRSCFSVIQLLNIFSPHPWQCPCQLRCVGWCMLLVALSSGQLPLYLIPNSHPHVSLSKDPSLRWSYLVKLFCCHNPNSHRSRYIHFLIQTWLWMKFGLQKMCQNFRHISHSSSL